MEELTPGALLLGRTDQPRLAKPTDGGGFVTADAAANLITFAPNRSGRVKHCLIPNLLTYPGSVVAIDLNGEAYAATAEARRRMGQTVVRLDPFGAAGPGTDSLDPFDLLIGLEDAAVPSACQDIANLLPLRASTGTPVDHQAFGLLCGLIGYLSVVAEKKTFDEIYPTLHSDDVVYSLAVVLDTLGRRLPKSAYSEIEAFLKDEEKTRNGVLARLMVQFGAFANPEVRAALRKSTFPVEDLVAGEPATVYLIIPAERMPLDAPLLRIWIGTLLHAVSRSPGSDGPPLLFLLDHCAELDSFPLLDALMRLRPTDSYRIWSLWHDVHQLRAAYPRTWPEIVAECGAVQVFGTTDAAAAAEAEHLLGLAANEVWSLAPGEQILRLDSTVRHARKIDLRDVAAPPRP